MIWSYRLSALQGAFDIAFPSKEALAFELAARQEAERLASAHAQQLAALQKQQQEDLLHAQAEARKREHERQFAQQHPKLSLGIAIFKGLLSK